MSNGYITLFGIRIPVPPPEPDQESEIPTTAALFPPDNHRQENPSDEPDLTLTLSTTAGDDVDLSTLRAEFINPTGILGLGIQGGGGGGEAEPAAVPCPEPSSTTGRQKRKPADEVVRARIIRRRRPPLPLKPQSDLCPEFLRMISPARPVFLYRKQLSDADVDSERNRLLVTEAGPVGEFLTEYDCARSKYKVVAIDMNGREYVMSLSCGDGVFVFNTEWSLMLRSNGVEALDFVELWGFRRGGWSVLELCLAVVFTRD